jgi:exonuclease VII small subunit
MAHPILGIRGHNNRMTDSSKDQRPGDLRSSAEALLSAARDAGTGAIRMPVASAQLIAQLPELVENLATATQRLNSTLDRFERYMALADPTLQAVDRLLPQLEGLVARGDDAIAAVRSIPGVGTFGRITGLGGNPAAAQPDPKSRKPANRPRRGRAD